MAPCDPRRFTAVASVLPQHKITSLTLNSCLQVHSQLKSALSLLHI